MEWFLLTARNSADTAAQIRIDFEFLKYGDVSLAAGHRDPFHTARLRMCALSATPDGTNTVFITNLDPVTGQLLDPSTHGQDYDASITTWATIGVAVKAPHFCSWNNDWFIGGVNSTSDPTYITITRDVNGDPLSHVATVVATGTILNPLFIQNKDATEVAWSGANPVATSISYGRADGVIRNVPNCSSADPDTGFRFPFGMNELLTMVTTGANRGLPQVTNVFTDVTTVLNISGWSLGVDLAFDPQAWFAPEFGMNIALAIQTSDRKTLRIYRGDTTSFATCTFTFYRDIAIDPDIIAAGTGSLYTQSPEPHPISALGRTLISRVIKDSPDADPTHSIISCTRSFIQLDDVLTGTTRWVDMGAGGAVGDHIHSEAEITVLGPDAGGRYQPLIMMNYKIADLLTTVPSRIWGVRPGIFYT